MQPAQAFGFEQVAREIIRGVLDTVGDQPGLSPERRADAQQALVFTLMAYNPRDPLETTMAGHCVVYDHLLLNGARDLLRGQLEEIKIKNRSSILSTGKLYLATLRALERVQGRTADKLAFSQTREVQTREVQTREAHPGEAQPPAEAQAEVSHVQPGPDDTGNAAPIAAGNLTHPTEASPSSTLSWEVASTVRATPAAPPRSADVRQEAAPLSTLSREPALPGRAAQGMPPISTGVREAVSPPINQPAISRQPAPRQNGPGPIAMSDEMASAITNAISSGMTNAQLEEALLAGLTPEEKQFVREGIARDKREAAERANQRA